MKETAKEQFRKELQRLPIFGLVMEFSRQLLMRLYDCIDYEKHCKVYNKAIFDMLLRDPRNIETFVLEDYDEIRFSEHKGKTDKNGKLKKLESVRADMVKRKTTYIKVNNDE